VNPLSIRTTRVPIQEKTKGGILHLVSTALDAPEGLLCLTIDLERLIFKVTQALPYAPDQSSAYQFVAAQPIEEVLLSKDNPYEELFQIFDRFRQEELFVTHFLCGSEKLQSWLRIPKRVTQVFGRPIVRSPELPEDVFLVCASEDPQGSLEDVQFSIKCTLP
jgi:hypothetical protein